MKLKDKYAVVTGASTGIGRAIAVELAREGSFVLLTARRKDKLEETKNLINNVGGKSDYIISDLADINSVNNLIQTVKSETKHVDLLANIAGIWHADNEVFADMEIETYPQQLIIDTYWVGVMAPTLLAHGLIPLMPKGANIINLSGTFESGAKGWLPYYVSNRAIEDLTLGLADELEQKGIKVNGISPSDTATEAYIKYFPDYAIDGISPEDIAKFTLDLCSKDSSGEVWVLKKGEAPFKKFHA